MDGRGPAQLVTRCCRRRAAEDPPVLISRRRRRRIRVLRRLRRAAGRRALRLSAPISDGPACMCGAVASSPWRVPRRRTPTPRCTPPGFTHQPTPILLHALLLVPAKPPAPPFSGRVRLQADRPVACIFAAPRRGAAAPGSTRAGVATGSLAALLIDPFCIGALTALVDHHLLSERRRGPAAGVPPRRRSVPPATAPLVPRAFGCGNCGTTDDGGGAGVRPERRRRGVGRRRVHA